MFRSYENILRMCLFVSLLAVGVTTCAENPDPGNDGNQQHGEVTLFNTEKHTLHSEIVNDDFEIFVSLPYTYAHTDATYPVLFNLDANLGFGITDNVAHILSTLNRELPELMIVGIAYPIKGMEDWAATRCRDFRPTRNSEKDKVWQERLSTATGRDDLVVESGGAAEFLNFIRDELIPFVESKYRVSSDRAITGVSASGLFTLYTLFEASETFQRYFAASPSINWDEPYMYGLEDEFAATHEDMPVRLYMCVGGLESDTYKDNMRKMEAKLRARGYPGLELETHVFENETHGSIYPASISRALKMLYGQ